MSVAEKIKISIEKSSWIRRMFEEGNARKAKYGADNVYDFSLGNPNLEPPARFREVVLELIREGAPGAHGYMPNAGFPETRQAVARYLSGLSRVPLSPEEIVMTVGAGGGLNVVLKTILNPGEEVVIPRPYFVEYNTYADNHRGETRIVPTRADFSLDPQAVAGAVTEKTRAVLINSPNNPTGRVYGAEELRELGEVLNQLSGKHGKPIYLISDEPYRKIVYDGLEVPSVFDFYRESFVVTSFSKDLSLPGERIGYVAAHPEISDKPLMTAGLVLSNRILGFVNAPALMQRAVAALLNESVDVGVYQKKRDRLCDALSGFGYEISKPQGAFYLFPRSPVEDEMAFVNALRDENILTVPGSGFGGPGHFRIAYCVSDRTIEKSLPGFERMIRKFRA